MIFQVAMFIAGLLCALEDNPTIADADFPHTESHLSQLLVLCHVRYTGFRSEIYW